MLRRHFKFTPPIRSFFSRLRDRWDEFWYVSSGFKKNKNIPENWQQLPRTYPPFLGIHLKKDEQYTALLEYSKWRYSKPMERPAEQKHKADPAELYQLFQITPSSYSAMSEPLTRTDADDDLSDLNSYVKAEDGNEIVIAGLKAPVYKAEAPEVLASIKLLLEKGGIDQKNLDALREEARVRCKWKMLALFSAYSFSQQYKMSFDKCILGLGVDGNLYGVKERLKKAIQDKEWGIVKLIESYVHETERFFGLYKTKYKVLQDELVALTPDQRNSLLSNLILDNKSDNQSPENLARIEILLTLGARRSLVRYAAYNKKWKIVKIFSSFSTDQHDSFGYGVALLHAAKEGRLSQLVMALSTAGGDATRYRNGFKNALAWTFEHEDYETFEHLLKNHYLDASNRTLHDIGYDLNKINDAYVRLKFTAIIAEYFEMPPDDPFHYANALSNAAVFNRKDLVDLFIQKGTRKSPTSTDVTLHWAAKNDCVEIFEHLLEKGFNPLARDNHGKTALDIIAERCKNLEHSIKQSYNEKTKKTFEAWLAVFQKLSDKIELQITSEIIAYRKQSWFSSKHRKRAKDLSEDITSAKGLLSSAGDILELLTRAEKQYTPAKDQKEATPTPARPTTVENSINRNPASLRRYEKAFQNNTKDNFCTIVTHFLGHFALLNRKLSPDEFTDLDPTKKKVSIGMPKVMSVGGY